MPLNINFQQILLHMFNFVILAFGLYMLLYKPVVAFMKKREDHFADLEKQAQEAKSQAEATLAEYNAKLAGADEEIRQKNAAAEQAGYPKGCIPIMPVADHEAVGGAREAVVDADVWKYAAEGKPLLAESLGAMERASEEGALLDVGSHVPITNGLSLAVASEFGAARVWLSPELTLRQIEEVAKDAPVELGVLLIGAQELMVTEHCMLMSQGPCDENCAECPRRKSPHVLKDRKGYEFPVVTDAMGRSHLYNAVELDIASSMPELLAAGISSYMVDATLMNAEETAHAVGRAIRALHVAQNDGNAIAKMPNTTSGHLYRGVS